jgi:hypothetical protein
VFQRREGWTGADGAYSVALPENRKLWLFSDTFAGAADPAGNRLPGWKFVHNSWALDPGNGKLKFSCQPLFQPPDGHGWFWVYASLLSPRGSLWTFLGQFEPAPGAPGFGFRQRGCWLAESSLKGPAVQHYVPLPCFHRQAGATVTFGAAVLGCGQPYVYVYGTSDTGTDKSLLLARVRLDDPTRWSYWHNGVWSQLLSDAAPLVSGVSNELSVYRERDGLRLLSQHGSNIELRRAVQPWGPFSPPVTVYRTPEAFSYNAKAHPEYRSSQGMLVTYNVNCLDPKKVEANAWIYRPRCLRLRDPWL